MEVDKKDFDKLKELVDECKENVSYELECVINEPVYKSDIDRITNYLKKTSRFE